MLSEIRDLFADEDFSGSGELTIGVSDAILSSWGPRVFHCVQSQLPDVRFTFHTHRTPAVLDRIRSGEFMAGVCTGSDRLDTDLQSEVLAQEPMVIIPSGQGVLDWDKRSPLDVISIEDYSGAWRSFRTEVRRLQIRRVVSLESFFSVAQMAIAGWGHGMVPIGVAETLGVPSERLINLGDEGLVRPVRFVARKSTYGVPVVASFYESMRAELNAMDF